VTKRWSETQLSAAAYLRGRGWPYAEAVGNGRAGVDVTGTPGLSIEVKSLSDDRRPAAMLKQAAKRAGLPLVVYRPPGYGPASVADWPCIMRFEDVVNLLLAAGYGDDASPTAQALRGEVMP
jgi:hypothetical protein